MILWSQLASSVSQAVVVAKPEVSGGNVVHVGQTLIIPLYDGQVSPGMSVQGLRFVGIRRIHKHDLIQDVGRAAFGGYDAASDRGAAFVVEHPGRGTINVTLRLPQYKYKCASCRTVHFFFRAI